VATVVVIVHINKFKNENIMLENLPSYISITFVLTTVLTLILFYGIIKKSAIKSTREKAIPILIGLLVWLIIQLVLTIKGIYNSDFNSLPPKLVLFGIVPMIFVIVFLFNTIKGKQFIDSLPITNISYLNVVRVPVEIVLFWLYLYKTVPVLMTFEGLNFDIIAGITAPFVAYFGLVKRKFSFKIVLVWNFICLGLLVNIIVIAFLSSPSPVQMIALDQPNIALFNFPMSWLPTFIVPIVIFGHLVSIRQLMQKRVN
jgi:hypothetical protein